MGRQPLLINIKRYERYLSRRPAQRTLTETLKENASQRHYRSSFCHWLTEQPRTYSRIQSSYPKRTYSILLGIKPQLSTPCAPSPICLQSTLRLECLQSERLHYSLWTGEHCLHWHEKIIIGVYYFYNFDTGFPNYSNGGPRSQIFHACSGSSNKIYSLSYNWQWCVV